MDKQVVRVGVAVMIWRVDPIHRGFIPKILMGLRKGSHGAGTWSLPGGHLELNETVEQCAAREVLEETGIQTPCCSMDRYVLTNIEGKTYVTLYAENAHPLESTTEAKLVEPDKCVEWRWVRWGDWPGPLFLPFKDYVDKYQLG